MSKPVRYHHTESPSPSGSDHAHHHHEHEHHRHHHSQVNEILIATLEDQKRYKEHQNQNQKSTSNSNPNSDTKVRSKSNSKSNNTEDSINSIKIVHPKIVSKDQISVIRSPSPSPSYKNVPQIVRGKETRLLSITITSSQCPIIYSDKYNISFYGIQKLHPFDCSKWGRTYWKLIQSGRVQLGQTVEPNIAQISDLSRVHTERYLKSLKSPTTVAKISEICLCSFMPYCLLDRKILKPLRYHVGGSILGVKLAIERGWAINIGGGFHHAWSDRGSGFCFYADISLCVRFLQEFFSDRVRKIMIVDLDAHQGNGHARDCANNPNVFIFDMFNNTIFPLDFEAKHEITCPVFINEETDDSTYLKLLKEKLDQSVEKFNPDFVIYNAGTDILENDRLGHCQITSKGIIQRDFIVFSKCTIELKIPILMLTSGGYTRQSASVIADSIINLIDKKIITIPNP